MLWLQHGRRDECRVQLQARHDPGWNRSKTLTIDRYLSFRQTPLRVIINDDFIIYLITIKKEFYVRQPISYNFVPRRKEDKS